MDYRGEIEERRKPFGAITHPYLDAAGWDWAGRPANRDGGKWMAVLKVGLAGFPVEFGEG